MSSSNFEVIPSEGYNTLKLGGAFAADDCAKLEKEVLPRLTTAPVLHLAVNCEALSDISPNLLRILLSLQKSLSAYNKNIRLVSASEKLANFLSQQGVKSALPLSSSLRAALVDFGLVTAKQLDVNFINPFLSATMSVLKIQASTESKAGQLFRRDPKDKFMGDVSGIIGLVSEAFSGAVVISFPESTFLKVMSRMLGEEITTMSKDIEDGAGEMTNIIFGQAKIVLNEKGYGIKTAIPSVVVGKDHSVQNISRGPRVTIPFTTDVGDFFIEICLSE